MDLDIKGIEHAKTTVEDAAKAIRNALTGEWNDFVHESFYVFLEDFLTINKKIEDACDKIESSASCAKELDPTRLQNILKTLTASMPKVK